MGAKSNSTESDKSWETSSTSAITRSSRFQCKETLRGAWFRDSNVPWCFWGWFRPNGESSTLTSRGLTQVTIGEGPGIERGSATVFLPRKSARESPWLWPSTARARSTPAYSKLTRILTQCSYSWQSWSRPWILRTGTGGRTPSWCGTTRATTRLERSLPYLNSRGHQFYTWAPTAITWHQLRWFLQHSRYRCLIKTKPPWERSK